MAQSASRDPRPCRQRVVRVSRNTPEHLRRTREARPAHNRDRVWGSEAGPARLSGVRDRQAADSDFAALAGEDAEAARGEEELDDSEEPEEPDEEPEDEESEELDELAPAAALSFVADERLSFR